MGPFGNADIFERVGRLAEKYRWMDEKSLASSLAYITGGKRHWIKKEIKFGLK